MKGTLADHPLAELIREIGVKGLSGTLRLERDRAKSAVYFKDGKAIFAASNLRSLRLREYLRKGNVIGDKELDEVGTDLSDFKLAGLLRDIGKASQKQIDALFAAMATDTLRVALLWSDGTWDFDERVHLSEPVLTEIDIPRLLREAAQRMPLPYISRRFQNPQEKILRTEGTSFDNSFLPAEGMILSRLDVPVALEELLAALDEVEAYRATYGLALSGLITREHWQYAFGSASNRAVQTKGEATPEAASLEQKPADVESQLTAFLERVSEATNYYEVIDLPPTAELGEIKDAYYSLARSYHPDRFHFQSGTSVHARISSAFARITQAYETLTDQKARATYDATLKRTQRFAEAAAKANKEDAAVKPESASEFAMDAASQTGEAEEHFSEGLNALSRGQVNIAVTHLAIASRLVPSDARYRANYGRALAANEQTRRLAENELTAAVRLEPAKANYRTMLAELYIDLKFFRRAQTELERALKIDPSNAAARSLLRKLEKAG